MLFFYRCVTDSNFSQFFDNKKLINEDSFFLLIELQISCYEAELPVLVKQHPFHGTIQIATNFIKNMNLK